MGLERRPAAILTDDRVGYSRLMAADKAGTFARQMARRAAPVDPKTAQYGKRIVEFRRPRSEPCAAQPPRKYGPGNGQT